jgi:hypothetical protein
VTGRLSPGRLEHTAQHNNLEMCIHKETKIAQGPDGAEGMGKFVSSYSFSFLFFSSRLILLCSRICAVEKVGEKAGKEGGISVSKSG